MATHDEETRELGWVEVAEGVRAVMRAEVAEAAVDAMRVAHEALKAHVAVLEAERDGAVVVSEALRKAVVGELWLAQAGCEARVDTVLERLDAAAQGIDGEYGFPVPWMYATHGTALEAMSKKHREAVEVLRAVVVTWLRGV
jgi:hypothetical protein